MNEAQQIPREPFSFDAEGFDEHKTYSLFRDCNGYTVQYHKVVCRFGENRGGYKTANFDVSKSPATIHPKGFRK